jgi:antidote-toxin recognition MazE-like antitoxin
MSEASDPGQGDTGILKRWLRAGGWELPDVNSPEFIAEARRQSRAIASSPYAKDDMDFVESISEWLWEDPEQEK